MLQTCPEVLTLPGLCCWVAGLRFSMQSCMLHVHVQRQAKQSVSSVWLQQAAALPARSLWAGLWASLAAE